MRGEGLVGGWTLGEGGGAGWGWTLGEGEGLVGGVDPG